MFDGSIANVYLVRIKELCIAYFAGEDKKQHFALSPVSFSAQQVVRRMSRQAHKNL